MKSVSLFLSCCLVALGLTACSTAQNTQAGTNFCFNCHSETSALGIKIKWAEAGYEYSVHKNGQVGRIYTQLAPTGGCPPFTVAAANTTCAANGGTSTATATAAGICTMPAGASQTQCTAAGGTYVAAVDDPKAGAGTTACPPFAASSGTLCTAVFGSSAFSGTTCTPAIPTGATYITQNACQSAGGTWVGPSYVLTGTEFEGSNAFYANSGGCQMCHTQEGFRKRVAGEYDPADGSYSIRFGWNTAAQVGTPSTTPNTPLTADTITNPSPLGCFGCHTPHGIGTSDNVSLDQTVPEGTPITTQAGGKWDAPDATANAAAHSYPKAKGHICAECHQIRLANYSSTIASILPNVLGASGKAFIGSYYGPHHGPQADMLLGTGGAQYAGPTCANGVSAATCAGAPVVTFAGTYGSSPHTSNVNADCVSCHMQSDFEDINVTNTFGVNAAVGGHSFTNKAIVHGAEKVLALGCGSVTDAVGCHTVSGVTGSSGNKVAAANVSQTSGYLQKGDAFFQKFTDAGGTTDSKYHLKMNELLTKLANPSANCTGLLQTAAGSPYAGGVLAWTFMSDGVTVDPRCIDNGASINKVATPLDDNSNASVRFLKALFNFKFAGKEDKSFGVHNTTYALELLYDSCVDLAVMTGQTCGANAGRCSFCEGTYVTTRP